ncbi:GMC oxidoreductase-like protein [Rhexocercosporidium sp. MPI-PUGE-AT-0058]|nr:GMC oxidoreductase-like protein [Rhexocercosporidium sp. MPI-PUGE-AT-0058]
MGNFSWLAVLALLATAAADVATKASYDYIVVGSGPAGGPLAAELAKKGASVLLLEAGDDQGENLHEQVAQWGGLANNDPLMRWDFFVKYHTSDEITNKYKHLVWNTTKGEFYVGTSPPAGAKRLGVYYPRAGTLGGCSTHNAQCAILPAERDWNEIADITNDDSWSADNMRKYWIQLENDHTVPKGTPGHGFNGFLDISLNNDESLQNQTEAQEVLMAAAKVMGQDPNKIFELLQSDMNNPSPYRDQQVGIRGFPSHRNPMGRRVSARDAVVQVANAKNKNGKPKYKLTVGLESFVTKVLFDTSGRNKRTPRAIGVEYLAGRSMYQADPRYDPSVKGVVKQVYAKYEVIIAGGTFNSPQILKLSGIGPKAELKKFKIPVLVDLPGVGKNLQDNTEMGVAAEASTNFTNTASICTFGAPGDPCLEEWFQGKGPYALGPLDALMFKSSVAAYNERDIFFFGIPGHSFEGYWPGKTVNVVPGGKPSIWDWSMVKIHPNGRLGTVDLVSANPREVPDINFRFFEEPGADKDLQALAEGVELGRKIFDSMGAPFSPWTETLPCKGNRNCDVKEEIKAQAWSHHATSTCAIGADDDPMAVLDGSFRVRGVNGLRVVDASSFPRTPGAFPVVPVFMIGLKGADVILDDPCEPWQ